MAKINRYLTQNSFQMDALSYIYSCYSFEEVQYRCFYTYGKKIMSSEIGRGKGFRKFYEFLLKRQDLVLHALQNQWFQCVPVQSVNFSNLIATLYYSINDQSLPDRVIDVLLVYYLNEDFNFKLLSEEDRVVVDAIIMKYSR